MYAGITLILTSFGTVMKIHQVELVPCAPEIRTGRVCYDVMMSIRSQASPSPRSPSYLFARMCDVQPRREPLLRVVQVVLRVLDERLHLRLRLPARAEQQREHPREQQVVFHPRELPDRELRVVCPQENLACVSARHQQSAQWRATHLAARIRWARPPAASRPSRTRRCPAVACAGAPAPRGRRPCRAGSCETSATARPTPACPCRRPHARGPSRTGH